MTDSGRAVFLSYASEDAQVAQHLCDALRAAGIEVWFDQSELRGGDVWDQKIRREIHDCALFIPVISVNTASRLEGYFRLEWKLAVDRSHLIAAEKPFLLPVVIDATQDRNAHIPDRFREVQWTRLPGGDPSPAFVERVRRLVSGEPSPGPTRIESAASHRAAAPRDSTPPPWRSKPALLAAFAVVVVSLGYLAANRLEPSKRGAGVGATPAPAAQSAAVAFNPPPHSIAVLPFVNLSGDKEQEYFSDGLTEELLNSLAAINELQVAARTSSFSFKEHPDIASVAHKLNVGAVLEGSVRRSAHTIRITAQLINATTGFHLWSKTYDRDLGDVLKLQTEIATAVAGALKVTLLGDTSAKLELGGTRSPGAFDAYLRAARVVSSKWEAKDLATAIAAYTEAIRLDPHFALAFAGRSIALSTNGTEAEIEAVARESLANARTDARQALALAPDLPQAHLASAQVWEADLNFAKASDAYEHALALAPGSAQVLRLSGQFAAYMGQSDAVIATARRAVVLDPLARGSHTLLGLALYTARHYQEAVAAFAEAISLETDFKRTYADRGFAYYALGDIERARTSCETKPDYWANQQCLAVIYDKLGKHADAEAELAKLRAWAGDSGAYQYATIYAQWGNRAQALEWLDTALRLRDPGLERLKSDPLMDPLRKESRFQAIMRELRFP